MRAIDDGDPRPPRLSLLALFLRFLRFGVLAFGGPVAQIAMVRQALVEEERWISPARFNRLLAVMQALPGPEAHELCVHLGMLARGRWGGLLAGLGFMLPGLLLMMVAGWVYVTWVAVDADLSGALLGVQIVVLAVILRAIVRIGQHALTDRPLMVIAVFSLIATLFDLSFWIPLTAGAAAYSLARRRAVMAVVLAVATGIAIMSHGAIQTSPGAAVAAGATVTLTALFLAGLKGGLLTFGGAYTAIPYVRADTVGRGWISDATFLDGIALAGVLPAPLVIFATFVGYVIGGPGGALAITAGMFLPAFAFSMVLFERLEAITENPALHRALAGVAAAVVGVIAATLVHLTQVTGARVVHPLAATLLFAVALAVVWRVKGAWVVPVLVVMGGVAGWVARL